MQINVSSIVKFSRMSIVLIASIVTISLFAYAHPAQAIIGGSQAQPTQPAIAKIVFRKYLPFKQVPHDTLYCSGALIDSQFVLTAQHCTNIGEKQGKPYKPQDGTVIFTRSDGSQETRSVTAIPRSPGYNEDTGVGDVALLKLSKKVTDITPLPLLSAGQFGGLTQVERFGWGTTTPTGKTLSDVLKYSTEGVWQLDNTSDIRNQGVQVNANCSIGWPQQYALWTYDIQQGGDAEGDSGGPVMDKLPSGQFAIAGVTSGDADLADCGGKNYIPDNLGKQWLGLATRVDQDSAEWAFITSNVTDIILSSTAGSDIVLPFAGDVSVHVDSKGAALSQDLSITSPVAEQICSDCQGGESADLGMQDNGSQIVFSEDGVSSLDPARAKVLNVVSNGDSTSWTMGFEDGPDADYNDLVVTVHLQLTF